MMTQKVFFLSGEALAKDLSSTRVLSSIDYRGGGPLLDIHQRVSRHHLRHSLVRFEIALIAPYFV